jgi:hypothetical protein
MVNAALTFSMTTRRPPFDPRSFGRRSPFLGEAMAAPVPALSTNDDWRLFATTYIAGFAFVSLFLA